MDYRTTRNSTLQKFDTLAKRTFMKPCKRADSKKLGKTTAFDVLQRSDYTSVTYTYLAIATEMQVSLLAMSDESDTFNSASI